MTFQTEPRDHRFFATISVLAAVTILIGFGHTYGAKIVGGVAVVPRLIHTHAAVFTCWLVLFITQVALVRRGRVDLHRRLGVVGMVLAAVMLVLGVQVGLAVARLDHHGITGVIFPDAAGFLLLNVAATLVFSTLAFAAWIVRDRPQAHKRLMLMATVGGLAPPGIARLPLVAGHAPAVAVLAMGFVFSGAIFDLVTRKRVHLAYAFGIIVAILGSPPVVGAMARSDAWHSLAGWLVRG
jgi:hypothetical protein